MMPVGSNNLEILSVLNNFDPISLLEMNGVNLMNRFDSKFCFTLKSLPGILDEIRKDYFVLEINGEKIQYYQTIYFDTPDDKFYMAHHNGKGNRLKVRVRTYKDSGNSFIEVKQKFNKGRIQKIRSPIKSTSDKLGPDELNFIRINAGIKGEDLRISAMNSFERITLINKGMTERCTIDINLRFISNEECADLVNIAVAEIKQSQQKMPSVLGQVFKRNRIYCENFSKYCISRALLQPSLKHNEFKPLLMRIQKEFISNQ